MTDEEIAAVLARYPKCASCGRCLFLTVEGRTLCALCAPPVWTGGAWAWPAVA